MAPALPLRNSLTGLGFLEGEGHPLPLEPMPSLAAPRGREDVAVPPSLALSPFRDSGGAQ